MLQGTICKPEASAATLSLMAGIKVNATPLKTAEDMTMPTPVAVTTISIAIICYALSFIIKEIKDFRQNHLQARLQLLPKSVISTTVMKRKLQPKTLQLKLGLIR